MFVDDDDADDDALAEELSHLSTGKKIAIGAVIIGGVLISRRPGLARKAIHFGLKGIIGIGGIHLGTKVGGHEPGSMANVPLTPLPPDPTPAPKPKPPAPDIIGQVTAAARSVVLRTYSRAISGAIAADPREGIGSTRVGVSMKVLTAADRKLVGRAADERNAVTNTIQNGFVDLVAASLTPDP